jgi:hypothetical protein
MPEAEEGRKREDRARAKRAACKGRSREKEASDSRMRAVSLSVLRNLLSSLAIARQKLFGGRKGGSYVVKTCRCPIQALALPSLIKSLVVFPRKRATSAALQAGWAGTEMARDVRFAERRRRGRRGEDSGETARIVPKERVELIVRDVGEGKR